MLVSILCLAICLVSAVLFIVARVAEGGSLGVVTKTMASFTFVISAIVAVFEDYAIFYNKFAIFIVVGLICGLIGDILLDLKVVYPADNDTYLTTGMISFGLGHACYAFAVLSYATIFVSITTPILIGIGVAMVLTPIIMLVSKKMKLEFGKFLIHTIIYTFILTFMVGLSIALAVFNNYFIIFAVAMFLFFLSDLVLSIMYFGGKAQDKKLTVINHALYYLAQIGVVALIFYLF